MAIDFPNGATTNDVYTYNGYSWVFDGSKWSAVQYEQPMDDNLFSISGSKPAGGFLTTDGASVYWSLSALNTNNQTGTVYTLLLEDQSLIIEMNNSSSNTIIVPPSSSVNFPIGTQLTIIQTGAGQTSITAGPGVTINCTPQSVANSATLRAQWSSAQLIKRTTDSWIAIGDLL